MSGWDTHSLLFYCFYPTRTWYIYTENGVDDENELVDGWNFRATDSEAFQA